MYKQVCFTFSFIIAFLLIVSSFAMAADTTEETAEAVEAVEPKKSPIKIGGAMRVNYAYGTYGSEDSPHPRLTSKSSASMPTLTITTSSVGLNTGGMMVTA